MDAVLVRVDPFGDCVAIDDTTAIFKDVGPDGPPGLLTMETFDDPDVRAAAFAIATSYPDHARQFEPQAPSTTQATDNCAMDISRPLYAGAFAFVDYSSPSGAIGVYVFRKIGASWHSIEHKQTGVW